MRSAIGGWVANIRLMPSLRNGLAIIRWLEFTSSRSGGSGSAWVPASSLRSAEARASGSPVSLAPSSSASYSRVRLIAIWISMAANGAAIAIRISATGLGRFSSLPPPKPPPKNSPIWATEVTTPAIAAATEEVRMSRL